MKRSDKLTMAVAAALGACGFTSAVQAATAYFDDFNRGTLNGGTYAYTQTVTAGNGGSVTDGSITGSIANQLTLTNDLDLGANANGYVYETTPTSAYTGFNQTLDSNTGNVMTWTLNMWQCRTSATGPAGFNPGNYGAAYILGATTGTFVAGAGAADGYAVIMGNSSSPDPIRLVKFTGGINNGTPTSLSFLATQNVVTDYWSIKVTYNPATSTWDLSTRDDGNTAFTDPATGLYTSSGSVVDTTYTGVALTHSGALWSYSTGASQTTAFDNFKLDVGPYVPPAGTPRNLVWDGDAGAGTNPSNVSGTWEAANNWWTGAANTTWSGTNPDNATFGTGAGAGTTTVTVGSAQTAGSLTFAAGSPTYTITGSGITLNGAAGVGIVAHQSAQINSQVSVATPQSWTVDPSQTLTIGDGTNGGLSLNGAITKEGTGTLVLATPSSTYGGAVTINAGTVRVTEVDANGRSGVGSGSVTINNGATFHIDNKAMGQSVPTNTTTGLLINNGGTLLGTGTAMFSGNNAPDIDNTVGTVANIKTLNSTDVFTINSSVRNAGSGTSGAKVVISGPGRIVLSSGGTSASPTGDQFSGTWELQGGILQLGPVVGSGQGEPLNSLGYDPATGPNGPNRPITLIGGTLAGAVTATNPNNPDLPLATSFRSPITLAGGTLGTTQLDANYAGDITLQSNSSVNTDDAVLGGTRNVILGTQATVAGSAAVPGDISWGSATLTVGGTGALKFQRTTGSVSVTPGATLQINAGATVELDGTQDALSDGSDHVNVINNSTTSLKVLAGTKNVGGVSGIGNTTVDASATLIATHIRQNALTVNGTLNIRPSSLAAGVSKVNTLAVPGKLDLSDNKLITQDPAGTQSGGIYNGVQGLVQSGYAGGSWTGNGIYTSQPDALGTLTTIGVSTGAIARFLGPTDTAIWAGQTINGDSTMVMYTYTGDANLDGIIDGTDYFYIDNNVGTSADGYGNGDFNYDGIIDGTDYFYIDSNIVDQGPQFFAGSEAELLAGVQAVPEPASLSVIGLGAAALMGRRRRAAR